MDYVILETEIVDLLEMIWVSGGGEKPVERTWLLLPDLANFEDKFNQTQDHLEEACGTDDFITGQSTVNQIKLCMEAYRML